jgi:hypothetical protein
VKFKEQGAGFWVLSIKQGPNHTKFYPRLLNDVKVQIKSLGIFGIIIDFIKI